MNYLVQFDSKQILPDIYFRSRNGHLTKLKRERLWIKVPRGDFLCLDGHYDRQVALRSPSPDLDDNKQDDSQNKTANNEDNVQTEASNMEK